MNKLTKGGIYAGIILGILLCARYCGRRPTTPVEVLPASDKARVTVDTKRHELVVTERNPITGKEETKRTFLPPRSDIEIKKDGSVKVYGKLFGFQVAPILGAAYGSDLRARAGLGLNFLYVKRWELGGGLMLNQDIRDTRAFVAVTYNAYNNMLVGLGIDNKKTAYVLCAVKF